MLCTFGFIDPQSSLLSQVVYACRACLQRHGTCTHMLFSVQTLETDDAVRNLACHESGVVACAKLIVPYTAVRSTWKYVAQRPSYSQLHCEH